MKKIYLALTLIALTVPTLTGCSLNTSAESQESDTYANEKYKIGITQIVDHPALNESRDGFIERLNELGIDAEISLQDAQGDIANAQMIAEKLVSDKSDLILSIATPTSQAVQNATKNSDIPVIFTAVSDPVFSGLVINKENPEANITGVTDEVSHDNLKEIIEALKSLNPDIKSIGIIYSTSESNSQVQVQNVRQVASDMNIEIEAVGIASINDIHQALESVSRKSQALILINDNMIASSMELVSKVAMEKGLITISAVSSFVEDGSLMSVGISYKELGRQSADMAYKVLKDKTQIAEIPVESSNTFIKKVNLSTLKALGLDENHKAFEGAEIIK
ncbi:putative ABC transport system substrate-binding protein [Acetoanaerobium pronyense]|uniref:ABC transport system substrate-binding protein n=1 Tax=Acetoanaerobium pronyense TaxID=1482736 RepID=A0ABS4KHR0_9FIRM|nr:ABC transporter substrate-binding protein [Acetoanaerobium pronyense]MBP2027294.1 putative ABC transport system substrate-binding protein [Acetoanaerobium pronyense]